MNADPVNPDVQRGYDRAAYGVTRDDLENMGERAVRDALNSGRFEHPGHKTSAFVSAWLADKDFVRTEEAASIAKAAAAAATASALSAASATTLARQARNVTIVFAIISTIVSIIAVVLKK